jgi:hypothetical protein
MRAAETATHSVLQFRCLGGLRCANPVTGRPLKTIEQIARETVHRLGADAVPALHKRAERAEAIGDQRGAEVWRDIAALAEGMLRDPCRLLDNAEGPHQH